MTSNKDILTARWPALAEFLTQAAQYTGSEQAKCIEALQGFTQQLLSQIAEAEKISLPAADGASLAELLRGEQLLPPIVFSIADTLIHLDAQAELAPERAEAYLRLAQALGAWFAQVWSSAPAPDSSQVTASPAAEIPVSPDADREFSCDAQDAGSTAEASPSAIATDEPSADAAPPVSETASVPTACADATPHADAIHNTEETNSPAASADASPAQTEEPDAETAAGEPAEMSAEKVAALFAAFSRASDAPAETPDADSSGAPSADADSAIALASAGNEATEIHHTDASVPAVDAETAEQDSAPSVSDASASETGFPASDTPVTGDESASSKESSSDNIDSAADIAAAEDAIPGAPAQDSISTEERIRLAAEAAESIRLSDADRQLLERPEVEVLSDILSVVNCALEQNRLPMLRSVKITNRSDKPLQNLELRVDAIPGYALPLRKHIDYISENSSLTLENLRLSLQADYLAGLTEKVQGKLYASLYTEERLIASEALDVTVLAFDEWHGTGFYPELLAAFVTPNHPEIARLTARAAQLLEEWSGDPSLDAYQSHDVNRVLLQAAAVYGAVQEQNIVYAVAPASFERTGQRVRLCDQIMRQKMGNCLELTLLYAACLESIGLHPLIVLENSHAFAGLWLDDLVFPESAQDDPSLITKRMAEGVSEIALVECTMCTAAHQASFDAARASAERSISEIENFDCVIDVNRARLSGIAPLPMRVQTDDGWHIDRTNVDRDELTAAPQDFSNPIVIDEKTPVFSKPRLAQWDRKLLDLGLRNSLISLRPTKTLIPILTPSLDELENALSDGSDFSIAPRPSDWTVAEDKLGFEGLHRPADQIGVIQADFKNKRLRSSLGEEELNNSVKELYRAARLSIEENGANTLYLALGLLKWYETDRSTKARYAPLVLIPVELVRRSARQGYVLRLRDEEPQMNITILEKLKQDFHIAVPPLDPLPLDEHGVDIRRVFTTLRKSVMGQARWDVLESAYLGTFSFSQFVMWNDIHSRADDLMRSKLVCSLIDGKLTWDAEDMKTDAFIDPSGILLPIPADASQLFAIRAACEGNTFVLHGPPGTGKSQTITALIANALAQGKTVLFVAEKMAALEVVQKRLAAIGIAPFCLELHSNKSKKRDLLDQLRQASEVTRGRTSEEYAHRADELAQLRGELDGYALALHKKQPCGLSVYELISRYEASKSAEDIAPFSEELLVLLTPEVLSAHEELIRRLIAAVGIVGHPAEHPLARVRCPQYSQQLKAALPGAVDAYRGALISMRDTAASFAEAIGEPAAGTCASLERLGAIAEELSFWLTLPRAWAAQSEDNSYLTAISKMAQHFLRAAKLRSELSALWQDSFFELSGIQLQSESNANKSKWMVARALAERSFNRKLLAHAKSPIAPGEIEGHILTLIRMQREEAEGRKMFAVYGKDLGPNFLGTEADWHRIAAEIARVAEHWKVAADPLPHHIRVSLAGDRSLNGDIAAMTAACSRLAQQQASINDMLSIVPCEDDDWIARQLELCDAIMAHRDSMKEWFAWNSIAAEACEYGLEPVVNAIRDGVSIDTLPDAYRKSVYASLATLAISTEPALDCFSGASFNERIDRFRIMDQRLQELAKEEIFCRLAAKVPNFAREAAQSSELGILQRAIRSGGRGVSIRRLFEQLPNLLPRLCPCMLMSPISAAQYLATNREPFDLVVFDEASQLPTCKSIGVLARGKDAVIVGDPKQMPPTSFFESNRTDEENLEAEDLESILDDCLALSMPQTHLLWHYRSRHESLIAYSNQAFYDNRLYTFPSVNDRETKVRLVPVDGRFDRGRTRTNRAEAEAVIEELKRRCHDPELSKLSVGVVTFNISQQHLIDDLLTDACKSDPQLEAWAYESTEPVFIKNLENVQGDERDVILFSVSFGADANNRVSMNFGPLNREGGWRRLNVAITRARHEMVIFSTLKPGQINLSRSNAAGVVALKGFLEYASGQPLPEPPAAQQRHTAESSGIAHSICELLRENGYNAELSVGHSEYRIDVGVIDPEDPSRYILGILLDGESYGSARTTRDREIAQIGVLNGLGWEILRVWSMDWWDNSRKEGERILKTLEALRKGGNRGPGGSGAKGDLLSDAASGSADDSGSADSQDSESVPVPVKAETPSPDADSTSSDVSDELSIPAAAEIEPDETLAASPADSASLPGDDSIDIPDTNVCEEAIPVMASARVLLDADGEPVFAETFEDTMPPAPCPPAIHEATKAVPYIVAGLPYTPLSQEQFLSSDYDRMLTRKIDSILLTEAPISESLLARRLLQSCSITRSSPRIAARIDALIQDMCLPSTTEDDRKFFWNVLDVPDDYPSFRPNSEEPARREPKDIAVQEAVNAVCQALEDQISLSDEDLVREAAKLMGFARAGAASNALFQNAVAYAAQHRRIVRSSNDNWILA